MQTVPAAGEPALGQVPADRFSVSRHVVGDGARARRRHGAPVQGHRPARPRRHGFEFRFREARDAGRDEAGAGRREVRERGSAGQHDQRRRDDAAGHPGAQGSTHPCAVPEKESGKLTFLQPSWLTGRSRRRIVGARTPCDGTRTVRPAGIRSGVAARNVGLGQLEVGGAVAPGGVTGDRDPQRGDDDRDRVRVPDPEGYGDRRGARIQRVQAGQIGDHRERLGLDALPRVSAGSTAPAGACDGAHPEEVPAERDRCVGRRRATGLPSAAVESAFGSRCHARSPETEEGARRGAHRRWVRDDRRRQGPRSRRNGTAFDRSADGLARGIAHLAAILPWHVRGVGGRGRGKSKSHEAGDGLGGNAPIPMTTA